MTSTLDRNYGDVFTAEIAEDAEITNFQNDLCDLCVLCGELWPG